jgi:hypothetical protein
MTIINNTDEIFKIGLLVIFPRTSAIVTKENFSKIIDKYPEVETAFIKGQIIAVDDNSIPPSDPTTGTFWYFGSGVPDNSLGKNLDCYLRTNGYIYQKVNDVWGTPKYVPAIVQSDIPCANAFWYANQSIPATETGEDGNYCINELTNFIYKKISGSWAFQVDITGKTDDEIYTIFLTL